MKLYNIWNPEYACSKIYTGTHRYCRTETSNYEGDIGTLLKKVDPVYNSIYNICMIGTIAGESAVLSKAQLGLANTFVDRTCKQIFQHSVIPLSILKQAASKFSTQVRTVLSNRTVQIQSLILKIVDNDVQPTETTLFIKEAIPSIPGGALAANLAGKYHRWIHMHQKEMGLGDSDGVPGEKDQLPNCVGTQTYVQDHSGRTAAKTYQIVGVDVEAVRSYLELGATEGSWIPLVNDCNTFCDKILDMATPKPRWLPKETASKLDTVLKYISFGTLKTDTIYYPYPVVIHRDGSIQYPKILSQ